MKKDKITIRITVNDEGYIEKEVEISPSLGMTSEKLGYDISDMIDNALEMYANSHDGIVVNAP